MITQQELNEKFPIDYIAPLGTKYLVGWYIEGIRVFIFVVDKPSNTIIFKSNSKSQVDKEGKNLTKIKQFNYIKKWYGKHNCDPPKEIKPSQLGF